MRREVARLLAVIEKPGPNAQTILRAAGLAGRQYGPLARNLAGGSQGRLLLLRRYGDPAMIGRLCRLQRSALQFLPVMKMIGISEKQKARGRTVGRDPRLPE